MVSRCFKYPSECHQIEISPQGSHATASTHISAHLSTCSSRIQDGTVSRAVLLNSVRGSGAATLQEEEWFRTSMRWHSAAVPCLGALLLALFAFFAFFAFFFSSSCHRGPGSLDHSKLKPTHIAAASHLGLSRGSRRKVRCVFRVAHEGHLMESRSFMPQTQELQRLS